MQSAATVSRTPDLDFSDVRRFPPGTHPGRARVVASPSEETNAGRSILAAYPNSTGSLGIAISEAVEVAAQDEGSKYAFLRRLS